MKNCGTFRTRSYHRQTTRAWRLGRDKATAQGGVFVLERFVEENLKRNELRVAVQGWKCGANAAQILFDLGYKIVAVSIAEVFILSQVSIPRTLMQ